MVFTETIICVKFGIQLFKQTEVIYVAIWLTIEVRTLFLWRKNRLSSSVFENV